MRTTPALAKSRAVAPRLLSYLEAQLGLENLQFAEPPVFLPDGWETYIYRFQLTKRRGLSRLLLAPLILRAYSSARGWPRLRHECMVHKHLFRLGYPVPKPLLLEKRTSVFGGPFMVMEALPGGTMLARMLSFFPAIVWEPLRLAAMHARLHRLPTEGFPVSSRPFLDRRLTELHSAIRDYALPGLRPGLRWLEARRPRTREAPTILHLDFHPANLIVAAGKCRGVIDWCEADVGDRHADIAATLLLIDSAPLKDLSRAQCAVTPIGRWLLRHLYLEAYQRLLPIDRHRLRYYLAWAALRRLARWGTWLRESPLTTGAKPTVLQYVTPDSVGYLENYVYRQTGVEVRLGVRRHALALWSARRA